LFYTTDELERVDENSDVMDFALDLFERSAIARQERDKILASGRALRVFDVEEFDLAHYRALHQQKVQKLIGQ
jgi:hypothetical protein